MIYKNIFLIIVCCIICFSLVYPALWDSEVTDAHTEDITGESGSADSGGWGMVIRTKCPLRVVDVSKPPASTATKCAILNNSDNYVEIANGTYVGDKCTFSDLTQSVLANDTNYTIINNATGAYDHVQKATTIYQENDTNINWEAGWFRTTGAFDSLAIEIVNVTTQCYTQSIGVELNSPPDNNSSISQEVLLNCTGTDPIQVDNVTLIIDNVNNFTKSGASTSLELAKKVNLSVGSHTWTCNATASSNNQDQATAWTVSVGALEHEQSYNHYTTEGSVEFFTINISFASGLQVSTVDLIYNNTGYTGTISDINGNNYYMTRNLLIPSVSATLNNTFYWNITLSDGSNVESLSYQQEVSNLLIDNCSTHNDILYEFLVKDEKTQIDLVAADNLTSRINLQLYSRDRSDLIQNYSTSFNITNPFQICTNTNLTSGENYSIDLQVFYQGQAYAQEFYHIQNSVIKNTSFPTNISLYNLDNATSQEFVITYKDENLLPVKDALIQIQRKYVGEGIFKTVEIPKTDSNGETLAHLEKSDVIYTFIVTKNGETLATFDDILAVCNNPTFEACEINLNSFSSHIEPTDFTVLDDFVFTLTFNRTTRTIQSIFSVPSGIPSEVVLNATLFDTLGQTQVCAQSLTSASGTLTCVVPASFGNSSVFVKLTKDGTLISQGSLSLAQDPSDIYGGSIVFIALFLFLTLIGLGVGESPVMTGIFLAIGAILAVALNIVNTGVNSFIGYGATILWLIIAIMIIIYKGANR